MITKEQFGTIEGLFNYYNQELFGGQLNDCLLNLSRKNGSMGFMSPYKWRDGKGKAIHEISINPDTFNIDDEEFHRTLIHEMCHLWQEDFGKPSRKCYHNKEWSDKMISVGLMPSHNGLVGGKTTGQSMNDYTIEGGLFIQKFREIERKNGFLKLPYYPVNFPKKPKQALWSTEEPQGRENLFVEEDERGDENVSKEGVKFKYTCACGYNVWGKFGLHLLCLDCNSEFVMKK